MFTNTAYFRNYTPYSKPTAPIAFGSQTLSLRLQTEQEESPLAKPSLLHTLIQKALAISKNKQRAQAIMLTNPQHEFQIFSDLVFAEIYDLEIQLKNERNTKKKESKKEPTKTILAKEKRRTF